MDWRAQAEIGLRAIVAQQREEIERLQATLRRERRQRKVAV